MKEKIIRCFVLLGLFCAATMPAQLKAAGEDRFDVLAKTIAPILALLTPAGREGNHALQMQASITEATGLPPQLIGASVQLAFEFPSRLRIQFPTPNGQAIICRNGQSVWAWPAAQFAPLLDKIGAGDASASLPTFEIDAQKAVLLPALFDVRDAGTVKFSGQEFRVLDVRLLLDLLNKKKRSKGYPVRVWIRPADHTIAQIAWQEKGWSATVSVKQMDFLPSLPPATWEPTPEQQPQVLPIPGDKITTLLRLALKQAHP